MRVERAEVSIGKVKIGEKPKIVAVVGGNNAIALAARAKREGADILEIRTDLFNNGYDVSRIVSTFRSVKKKTSLPLLITIRRLEEGGLYYAFKNSEKKRLKIFRSVMDYVSAVDIELTSEIRDDVIGNARKHNVVPIVSHHDFYKTPSLTDLRKIVKEAYEVDSEIVKIATMANDKDDVVNLFRLLLEFNGKYDKPITVIAMSRIGAVSRIAFPLFGSSLTYGFLSKDKANAPGQLTVKILRDFINKHKDEIPKIRSKLPRIRMGIENGIYPISKEKLAAMI